MSENKYSKKEILIFDGFSKLVESGVSINNIRVADIAKAAGIGKGTVYEYFKTKEEVIARSIIYKMESELKYAIELSSKSVGFEEKCNVGLLHMINSMSDKLAYFQLVINSNELHQVFNCLNEEQDKMGSLRDSIFKSLDPTIDAGISEGIINSSLDIHYIKSVFISVCSGLCTMMRFYPGELTEDIVIKQKDIAYTMIVKALK